MSIIQNLVLAPFVVLMKGTIATIYTARHLNGMKKLAITRIKNIIDNDDKILQIAKQINEKFNQNGVRYVPFYIQQVNNHFRDWGLIQANSTLNDYIQLRKKQAQQASPYFTKRQREGIYFKKQLKISKDQLFFMEFGECLFFYVQNRIVNANASFGELFDHSAKNGILHIRYTKVETFG